MSQPPPMPPDEPTQKTETRSAPGDFYSRILRFISSLSLASHSKGITLAFLENNDVSVVRAIGSATSDAAIFIDEQEDLPTTLLGRFYHSIDHKASVVPFDLKKILRRLDGRGWNEVIFGKQSERAQFLLIEFGGCQMVRVLVPRTMFHICRAKHLSTLAVNYGSGLPSVFASCVVRCRDLPEASKRIQACAKDPTKPYINPTTKTNLESALFTGVSLEDQMTSMNDNEQLQRRMLYDEMLKHNVVFDVLPLSIEGFDHYLCIDGRYVLIKCKFGLYKVDTSRRIMSHQVVRTIALPRQHKRRVFHHTQQFEYLFTQDEAWRGDAYLIPQRILPDSWYTSDTEWAEVALETLEPFKIDTSQPDWGLQITKIVKQYGHELKPRTQIPEILSSGGDVDISDMPEIDDDDAEYLRDVTAASKYVQEESLTEENRLYFQLLSSCAEMRFGLVIPFDSRTLRLRDGRRLPDSDHGSYLMVLRRWSPDDVEEYQRDRTLSERMTHDLSPYSLVIPFTIIYPWQDIKASKGCFGEEVFDRLAQPFRQLVIMADQYDDASQEFPLLPSEVFRPKKAALVEMLKTQTGQGQNGIRMVDFLTELHIHYLHRIHDIPAAILGLIGPDVRGKWSAASRAELDVANKTDYVMQYQDLLQIQADRILAEPSSVDDEISASDGEEEVGG